MNHTQGRLPRRPGEEQGTDVDQPGLQEQRQQGQRRGEQQDQQQVADENKQYWCCCQAGGFHQLDLQEEEEEREKGKKSQESFCQGGRLVGNWTEDRYKELMSNKNPQTLH